MNALLILPALLLSCNSVAMFAPRSTPAACCAERFPEAQSPLSVKGGAEGTNLGDVLGNLSRSTGLVVTASSAVSGMLAATGAGLMADAVIPAEEAYSFTESLLAANGFYISSIHGGQTPTIQIVDVRSTRDFQFLAVAPAELDSFSAHPSLLVTVNIEMKTADTRQFANSMRQVLTNPASERIVAFGSSGALQLSGPTTLVKSMIALAQAADGAAEARAAKAAGSAAEDR
ncbi:MAG: hypothetical protein CMK00_03405 [Planctomycetes bacterium]|nr:hypothetical protein [Planctomycetota bacterium]HJO25666.1 hypothetical protein [Planctomycetota bacterium]